ncbi:MAG TPA: 3-beta hydroxysteroid dehydrogenase, partial [Streptosporangiaceae bacterium]|nr:3-beta hydroxysteroid dehydrogenase [Streptosporangiaceae bacterium]
GAATADRTAVDTFGDALAGSGKPFVIASGLLGLTPGKVATERDGLTPDSGAGHGEGPSARLATAHATLALADRGVRSSVLRLPPTVHGDGDNGFMTALVGLARQHGNAAYVGDGSNRWPAVHVLDAAYLFRLAVEQAPAGSVLHAVADEGVPIRDIAAVIGRHLDLPTASAPAEDFGFLGRILSIDQPASSALTRELLGWRPVQPGLIDDLDKGHYFG